MKKKVLISTGGTGGHVIPAIALYDHLKKNFSTILVVDERGANFIDKNNYDYKILQSPRLTLNILKLPLVIFKFIISFLKSFFLLKNNKIDVLLATGGYMSVPISLAAKLLNIKIYLLEPNIVVGRANKFLIKFCNKIFCYSNKIINFPKKHINKITVVEHILRKEIYNFKNIKMESRDVIVKLLIIGGSQGAKFFDQNLKDSIVSISKKFNLKIYHQVSTSEFNDLKLFYKDNKIENKLFNFEDNIFQYISDVDLAITRAGASTLSELAYLQVPFIAIPYKFAIDNHQLENALNYEKNGCCWILNENDFNHNKLTTLLLNIINNKQDYLNKKKNLEKFFYQNNWNNINEKLTNYLNEN
tara:strand:- start:10675 stop:11751 length:1077 start_codon:yes stop_codon:yes gene_type:complete